MKLPDTRPGLWKERYENLRRHCLENRHLLGTDPLDLILFLRRGVAGWMRSWAALPPPGATAGASPALPLPEPPLITATWQRQLTVVLAQMTARHLPFAASL
jgi:hypothetical protein